MEVKEQKLIDWAKREVEIAKEKEPALKDALNISSGILAEIVQASQEKCIDFNSLRTIISNLMFWQPLSPIEDTDDIWELVDDKDGFEQYQCLRYPGLFKGIKKTEGKEEVRYVDSDRYVCIDINHPDQMWTGGIGGKLLEEIVPIKFPYMPGGKIKVYMENLKYHKDNEFVDTAAVMYFRMPEGDMIEVKRFFKILNGETIEIDKHEYFARKAKTMEDEDGRK